MYREINKTEFAIDAVEFILAIIFLAFTWSSSLTFLKFGTESYWIIWSLTLAYIIFLALKIIYKYRVFFRWLISGRK
jgi:hypothetical protein